MGNTQKCYLTFNFTAETIVPLEARNMKAPVTLPLVKEPPSTHWIGGWVGPTAGLDYVEK
jgi:hypothetical protein